MDGEKIESLSKLQPSKIKYVSVVLISMEKFVNGLFPK